MRCRAHIEERRTGLGKLSQNSSTQVTADMVGEIREGGSNRTPKESGQWKD